MGQSGEDVLTMIEKTQNRKRWILNSPYEEPSGHWILDSQGRATESVAKGRRESAELVPVPSDSHSRVADPNLEPYQSINRIRTQVRKWRHDGYPTASLLTRSLLEYFAGSDLEPRPFWCQVECLETIAWIFEGGYSSKSVERTQWNEIVDSIKRISGQYNEEIERYAFKMATGSGKTKVMAMMLAWLAIVRGTENALVITPNLSIKYQLLSLKEQAVDMVPRKYREDILKLKLSVLNFQTFAPRDVSGFRSPPSRIHRQVVGVAGDEWVETPTQMIDRLLRDHDKSKKFVVLNDEAHHCRFTARKEQGEDNRERRNRMMWASALKQLHKSNMLDMVLDFSATPMYLQHQKSMDSMLFPWTITDFPLLESIESGLVKIPRLPSVDGDEAQQPVARKIYENTTDKELKCESLQNPVKILLDSLARNHEEEAAVTWRQYRGVEPVFIVVANTIANAVELYKYIAGYESADGWVSGRIRHFSNVRDDAAGPVSKPRTVLVASNMDESNQLSIGSDRSILDEQIKVHAPDLHGVRGARTKFQERLRDIYMTVGKKGELGSNIRCVVSVSMLTEGWDCRNVTSVFGFRQFGSALLCEQVVGRSLRRTEHTIQADGKLTECYADIFGVPFEFMKSRDNTPPVELTHIYSVPERKQRYHIEFPCIDHYRYTVDQIGKIHLDSSKIMNFRFDEMQLESIETKGVIGETSSIEIKGTSERSAILRLAAVCTDRFLARIGTQNMGFSSLNNRNVFRQFSQIVRDWWRHENTSVFPQCISLDTQQPDSLTSIIADQILDAITSESLGWKVALEGVIDKQIPVKSTSNVNYKTACQLCPPTERSEINRAVCDSEPESRIVQVLDSHSHVSRWARNEKIGLQIPWFDTASLRWRRYEPDFIAHGIPTEGMTIVLVIEFKGIEDDDALAKRMYAEEFWIPSVNGMQAWSKGKCWKYLYLRDSRSRSIRRALTEALTS